MMKAIVTVGDGTFKLQDIDVPALGLGQVLVKVVSVAQNPTDWKTLLLHTRPGNILGCDFAGTVVALGPEVPSGLRKLDEMVAGCVHGGISPNGAFAEYVAVDAALLIPIPNTMSFEHAAQLGVACFTTCQALYQTLHLPAPLAPSSEQPGEPILIWSGTSATGQYAVQFAKLGGLRVLSTASPRHFDLVRALGADAVFDYADSYSPRRICAEAGGKLRYAVDCISEGMTLTQVSMSLGKEGGTIATLLPYESRRRDAPVETIFVLAYSMFGKAVEFPFEYPQNADHYENGKVYAKLIAELLDRGALKPVPMRLYPHGLASVKEGLEDMKDGKVHAEKVTYRIADTPGLGSTK
ncbi:chaperonin 10-like protein [Roridomyces roridus]|uniref:Chaperonin 10-like protein n=1 Tax=Roridomyces roridus TaxID=1738132 RepID=A0AAD7FK56_9AGAR|nr:chaperonin 10-like protein [Roridomyces roridus]